MKRAHCVIFAPFQFEIQMFNLKFAFLGTTVAMREIFMNVEQTVVCLSGWFYRAMMSDR